jgi:DNA circularisation protein N-terminus
MPEPITPMLGDVELRTVQNIATVERRALVEHRVPGMAGSAFQDLGRPSTSITLDGILFGEASRAGLESLRAKFQAAEPVSFTADIATATEIVDVLIEDLRVVEVAGRPDTFLYQILLRESPPPPPPADPLSALNADILGDAQDLFDQATGLADVLNTLGNVPSFGDPTEQLSGLLNEFESVTVGMKGMLNPLGELFA